MLCLSGFKDGEPPRSDPGRKPRPGGKSGQQPHGAKGGNVKHTVRTADGGLTTIEPYPRGLSIKVMCSECLGWEGNPKAECASPLCPLYPYRRRTLRTQKGDKP